MAYVKALEKRLVNMLDKGVSEENDEVQFLKKEIETRTPAPVRDKHTRWYVAWELKPHKLDFSGIR
ncbi:MAG TPA: hypothetical protein EYO58_08905 [Flavobacteriales bacterium]|nr:hypothetical protein [Flavobacteriales bacterium]